MAKVSRSYSLYLHLSSPPTLSHSLPLYLTHTPLLCISHQPTQPPPSPLPGPLPHEPLAALVLEECGTAWGLSASEWQVGGECDTAQFITCDANGLVTGM
ncbi:unnamed protein product [Closterium sp. NIES-65]|nr:unnamed protein product [Closterium sp. NIES-65]